MHLPLNICGSIDVLRLCLHLVPKHDSRCALMWTHLFSKYSYTTIQAQFLCRVQGFDLVLDGTWVFGAPVLNATLFCTGSQAPVLGQQMWTQPYHNSCSCWSGYDHAIEGGLVDVTLALLLGSLSKGVFERRTATGNETFSLFTRLGVTTFVILSVFTLIEIDLLEN